MPWKNGLGTTTEIAVHPPGAGLDDFTWRLSIADLGASGPFSTFAGCDRILVQIEGAPITLSHEGADEHHLRLLSPHRFAGELATYCTLDMPPARDLNVMVRRDRASADVSVHELALGATAHAEHEATTRIVHVLRGSTSVQPGGETAGGGDTLVAQEATSLAVTATSEGTVVVLVAIGPPGR
jgi:environmental stress-induced protein Ves